MFIFNIIGAFFSQLASLPLLSSARFSSIAVAKIKPLALYGRLCSLKVLSKNEGMTLSV